MSLLLLVFFYIGSRQLSAVHQTEGKITVTVDPRIELISSIKLISNYNDKYPRHQTRLDFSYIKNMDSYFSKYRTHEVVLLFEKMSSCGFTLRYPPLFMLHLSNPSALKQRIPFDGKLIEKAGGETRLNQLSRSLTEYAHLSDFRRFYEDNQDLYEKMIQNTMIEFSKINPVETLEDYFGMEYPQYFIILSPIQHEGGFGVDLNRKDGKNYPYAVIGPTDVNDNVPSFGTGWPLIYLVWHELGHSFTNSAMSQYLDDVNKYEKLQLQMVSTMAKQGYATNSWELIVDEHIARAVTTRLTYLHFGKEKGDEELNLHKSQGWLYIEDMVLALKEYEGNRQLYPDFNSFYPALLTVFDKYIK